jgi:fibronectin type 3 domain-containing protein
VASSVISIHDLEVDNTIQQDSSGAIFADNGIIRADFIEAGNTVKFTSKGRTITWTPQNMRYVDSTGMEDVIYQVQDVPLEAKANYARFNRTMPDVDDWFIVENDRLKHQIIVQGFQRDPAPYLSEPIQFAIGGQLTFDADLTVRSMGMTLTGAFQTSDAIQICDGDEVIFTLPAVVAYDSKVPERAQVRGMYNVTTNEPGNLAFDIVVDNAWMSDIARVYPVIIDPTVIVASAYDTSGNGGRKIVRLSNGWIVACATNNSSGSVFFYVSKDNGVTWSSLCQCSFPGDSYRNPAIAASGTTVYVLMAHVQTSIQEACFVGFDATTITPGTNLHGSRKTVDSESTIGTTTLAIDGTGALHAAWSVKGGSYVNSYNIFYSKSTDGGNTWASPTQITTSNTAGLDNTNPCIVVRSNNYPTIIWQYSGNNSILSATWNGSAWGSAKTVYNDGSYAQASPCAAVDGNDKIHVTWHGKDATDNAKNNIRYSRSSDGGQTWSAATKLTSGNTYDQQYPSITIDQNNQIRVFFQGRSSGSYDQIRKIESSDGGSTWSSVTDLTSNTTASAMNPQTLWSKFNMNSSDAVRFIWQDAQANAVKYDSIVLNNPPNAPTLNPVANFDATTAKALSWTFSDPNQGDSQSAYQLQIVDTGTGQTVLDTGKVGSTLQSYTLAANTLQNGKRYQWRVMVWDQQNAQSPWSSYGTFETAAAPTVQITSPSAGGTVATSSVTPQWSYSDPAGNQQATYQVQLLDSNNVVLWDSGQQSDPQGTVRALTVGYTLANNTTYKLKVIVTNAKGIQAMSSTVTFTVSFTPPATPTLTATPQNGYIHLAINNPAPSGSQPTVAYNDIYRRETGTSTWTRIATNIPNNGVYDDYAVASGKQYDYKVTAVGNNGTSSDSAVASKSITLSGVWLHDPLDPAGTIRNFRLQERNRTVQTNYAQTMMQFEGRNLPVADIAGQMTQQVQVTISCTSDSGDLAALYSLIGRQSTLLYRDTRGRKIYGVVAAIPETEDWWGANVQLTIQAVDYQEAI